MPPDDLRRRLAQVRDDAVRLFGKDGAPWLCRLSLQAEAVADGYSAIAPAQRAAGRGWLECADEAAWFDQGDDFARHAGRASPLLAAELAVEGQQRSLHLRRTRTGLVVSDMREHAHDDAEGAVGSTWCLARHHPQMSRKDGRWLDYTVYWTLVPVGSQDDLALRPWRSRLAGVRDVRN